MSPDVAIVGGGVIGCAIARELARRGAGRIVVVERGQPGGEASGAAAGLLATASSRAPAGALFELRRASAALFPSLAEALREETGIDVEYSSAGLLGLAFSDDEAKELAERVARRREQGFSAEFLDAAAARECESAISPALCAAAHFADDRSVDSMRLVEALHDAARASGVEFRLGTALEAVEAVDGRVLSIRAGGGRLTPGHMVVAAGAWSPEVGALLRVKVPVRPDRGEMLAVRPAGVLRHTLCWNDGYLVPRTDGTVRIGSTSARGEWEKVVTVMSLELLVRRAVQMVPGLAGAALVRTWAGLRPMSTLRRPIIGPLQGYTNVTLATGHHRSGVLLAPITARLIAELLAGETTSLPLEPFRYRSR